MKQMIVDSRIEIPTNLCGSQEEEEENKSKSRSPTPMIDDLDDLHDIEIDDIDENLWVNIRMAKNWHAAKTQ